jgi:hypothetical protein
MEIASWCGPRHFHCQLTLQNHWTEHFICRSIFSVLWKAWFVAKLSIWLVSAGSASFVSDPPPLFKFIIKSFGHIHSVPLIFANLVNLSDIVSGLFSVESLLRVSHSWVRVSGVNHIALPCRDHQTHLSASMAFLGVCLAPNNLNIKSRMTSAHIRRNCTHNTSHFL